MPRACDSPYDRRNKLGHAALSMGPRWGGAHMSSRGIRAGRRPRRLRSSGEPPPRWLWFCTTLPIAPDDDHPPQRSPRPHAPPPCAGLTGGVAPSSRGARADRECAASSWPPSSRSDGRRPTLERAGAESGDRGAQGRPSTPCVSLSTQLSARRSASRSRTSRSASSPSRRSPELIDRSSAISGSARPLPGVSIALAPLPVDRLTMVFASWCEEPRDRAAGRDGPRRPRLPARLHDDRRRPDPLFQRGGELDPAPHGPRAAGGARLGAFGRRSSRPLVNAPPSRARSPRQPRGSSRAPSPSATAPRRQHVTPRVGMHTIEPTESVNAVYRLLGRPGTRASRRAEGVDQVNRHRGTSSTWSRGSIRRIASGSPSATSWSTGRGALESRTRSAARAAARGTAADGRRRRRVRRGRRRRDDGGPHRGARRRRRRRSRQPGCELPARG